MWTIGLQNDIIDLRNDYTERDPQSFRLLRDVWFV